MTMDLNELADRVEALSGPDRDVDDAIATAIYSEPERHCIKGLSDEAGGMWMFRYPNGSVGSSLRFTGSLDAAMTLVPGGKGRGAFHVQRSSTANNCAVVWFDAEFNRSERGDAKTPALALASAALRACARGAS